MREVRSWCVLVAHAAVGDFDGVERDPRGAIPRNVKLRFDAGRALLLKYFG